MRLIAAPLVLIALLASSYAQSQADFEKAKGLYQEGNAANSRGDFAVAVKKYTEAISVYPFIPEVYFNRAVANRSLGNFAQAAKDLEALLDLKPNLPLPLWADFYHVWGLVLQEKGDYELALDRLDKALQLSPDNATIYYGRANTYFFLKRHDEAMRDYNKSIEMKPQSTAFYNRARLFNELGQLEKAKEDYSKSIELDPKYAEAYSNRGLIYQKGRQLDLALKDFNTALSLSNGDAVYHFNRGNVYLMKLQYALAVADYSKAIEVYPKWALAYKRRSEANKKLGRTKLSEADALKAKDLEKENFNPVTKTFIGNQSN
ncbi:MAG: tetratricopeptide repeat protein [Pyrinomonadaceae bacterium]